MGDEPYMLLRKLNDIPVIVDPDRIRAAKQAIKDYAADTVILDDAFQQWRIKKDLEIVTIDATRAFGNRYILPRGILREPLSALRRADIFVITKTNLNSDIENIKDVLSQINPSKLVIESMHSPVGFSELGEAQEFLKSDALRAKAVTLFSGIGDPDSFENLIASLKIKIGLSFRFPDHHHYTQQDLENIIQAAQKKSIDTLITTEKDAVRLEGLRLPAGNLRLLVLGVALKILKDEERFTIRLLQLHHP
jgi:tetraacyldisaccharide 4'-kinase